MTVTEQYVKDLYDVTQDKDIAMLNDRVSRLEKLVVLAVVTNVPNLLQALQALL